MRHLALGVVAVVVAIGCAASSRADVIVDFSASPTTLGFSTGGNVDPDTMLNTSTGVWDVNLAGGAAPAGQTASYNLHSLPATFTTDTVSGSATIAFSGGSSNMDDRTILFLSSGTASGGYAFSVAFAPGAIQGYKKDAGSYSISVSNDDGQFHTYGWSLDRVAQRLSITFDNTPVGDASYNVAGNWAGEELMYFGDATRGSTHAEVWDSWSVRAVPEPSTVALVASGLIGLLCYAWKRRR
jgi:hypothetical protein